MTSDQHDETDDETRVVHRDAPDDATRVVSRPDLDDATRVVTRATDDETRVVVRDDDATVVVPRPGEVDGRTTFRPPPAAPPAADGIPVVPNGRQPFVPGGVSSSPADSYGIRNIEVSAPIIVRPPQQATPARTYSTDRKPSARARGRRQGRRVIIVVVVVSVLVAATVAALVIVLIRLGR